MDDVLSVKVTRRGEKENVKISKHCLNLVIAF